ncbi:nuclear transport factor 2 family protein [Spirosoma areae]
MTESTTTLETGALEHPNVQRIRAYQAAMARGDYEAGATVFDPEVTYTVPGHNALSGVYQGPAEVMGYLGRLMELTQGTYSIREMHWLVNEKEEVILFIKNQADRNNRSFVWEETILFQFKNGKKFNLEHFQADQAGVDAFLGL